MKRTAYLFPGQGSQRVGMGADLLTAHRDLVGPLYRRADDLTGFPLSKVCFEGPEEELRRTDITQPAIFLTSIATHLVLSASLPPPNAVAGHSLGEYAAYVAAGVLKWEDALHLVLRRGELMAGVNDRTPGAMLAVLGVETAVVQGWCDRAATTSGEVIEVANDNEATQTVVSGTRAGVATLREIAHADSAGRPDLRLVPLGVGAPFHCSLMSVIEAEFGAHLDAVTFTDPLTTLVSTVTGRVVETGAQARECLRSQLSGAVLWRDTLTTLTAEGTPTFVEVGPGRVLTGIAKRSYPDAEVHSASDARRIARLVGAR